MVNLFLFKSCLLQTADLSGLDELDAQFALDLGQNGLLGRGDPRAAKPKKAAFFTGVGNGLGNTVGHDLE